MISVKETYEKEIEKIIKDKKNKIIFLVGSSKDSIFKSEKIYINDIDIFIISNQSENQIREIKKINNINFDLNYFSIEYANKLISNKEYFFISQLKDAKVIYDKENMSKELIITSKEKYDKGPDEKNSYINLIQIYENIIRLKDTSAYSKAEYEFLTNLYLKDIISEYFIINKKWIPKHKKVFSYLRENDKQLLNLIQQVYEKYDYKNLESVYKYVFKEFREQEYIKVIY